MMKEMGEEAVTEVKPDLNSTESENTIVDLSNSTGKLADGLLSVYQRPLEQIRKELNELTRKQESLIDRMRVENFKLKAQDNSDDWTIKLMSITINSYVGKLSLMKRQMTDIHERTSKLKKRALRLQQIKQEEALSREHHREQESRREQELIGKPPIP